MLTNLNYDRLIRFQRSKRTLLTLSLCHVYNPTQVGLAGIDDQGQVIRFLEKPEPEEVFTDLANSGILICEPAILSHIPQGTLWDVGHDLLPDLLGTGEPLHGLPLAPDEYLIHIGTIENYERAQHEWPEVQAHPSS